MYMAERFWNKNIYQDTVIQPRIFDQLVFLAKFKLIKILSSFPLLPEELLPVNNSANIAKLNLEYSLHYTINSYE